MAKISSLRVGPTLQLLNAQSNIEFAFFKNVPSTLINATGHNHDLVHYSIATVNSKFKVEEDRVDVLVSRIEAKAVKYDLLMAGGGTNANSTIHNYNLATEVFSQITAVLPFTSLNAPGITSSAFGYLTNTSNQISKFNYFTRSFTTVPNCPILIKGTMIDYAIQQKGYVSDGALGWRKLDVKLDTWETRDSCAGETDGRPLLSSITKGYSKKQGSGAAYEYSYLSSTSRTLTTFTTTGITSGLCRNSNYGFWLSSIGTNFKHVYLTDAFTLFTGLTSNVNNTNTLTNDSFGLIVSGSDSTNVRKLNWSTEAISVAVSATVNKSGASSVEQ
jgi:hypothetical protein